MSVSERQPHPEDMLLPPRYGIAVADAGTPGITRHAGAVGITRGRGNETKRQYFLSPVEDRESGWRWPRRLSGTAVIR